MTAFSPTFVCPLTPISKKCPFGISSFSEQRHLEYHAAKRKKPFLKIRVLPGETYTSDHVLVKNSFRYPIYISISSKEKEIEKTMGVSAHSDWSD